MKTDTIRRWARRTLGAACVLGAVGCAVAWWVAGALVAPQQRTLSLPDDLACVRFQIQSESGARLHGWSVDGDPDRGVVVLVHGIGGSRLAMLGRARLLNRAGYSVVMIDLQAHGESEGHRITLGHLERHDVRAAVEYARQALSRSVGWVDR